MSIVDFPPTPLILSKDRAQSRAGVEGLDPELQPYLARQGLRAVMILLSGQPRGECIEVEPLAALVTLIDQANMGETA